MSNQRDIGGYDANAGRDTGNYADVIDKVIASLRQSVKVAQKAGCQTKTSLLIRASVSARPGIRTLKSSGGCRN